MIQYNYFNSNSILFILRWEKLYKTSKDLMCGLIAG